MSTPKTAGKTGETGKPSIDAGFRSSGLQKGDREKPGIRGAGAHGPGAEMAATAPPKSDPPPRKPGRPPGTTRGPGPKVQRELTDCVRLWTNGRTFAAAARKATGSKKGDSRLHKYRQCYPEFFAKVQLEIAEECNIEIARELFPEIDELARAYAAEAGGFLDRPGKRNAAKFVRENPDILAYAVLCVAAKHLCDLMNTCIERGDDIDTEIKAIDAWKKTVRELFSGPSGRI